MGSDSCIGAQRLCLNRLQLDPNIAHGIPSFFSILRQTTPKQVRESRVQVVRQAIEVRVELQDGREDVGSIISIECLMAGQHFEQNATERKDIAARIGRPGREPAPATGMPPSP